MSDTPKPNLSPQDQAQILSEALPYMRRHAGHIVVVKYGGHAMGESHLAQLFASDIVMLKHLGLHPIVVHGGGPQIGAMLERLKIVSSFVDGLRVTDAATVEVVEVPSITVITCRGGPSAIEDEGFCPPNTRTSPAVSAMAEARARRLS